MTKEYIYAPSIVQGRRLTEEERDICERFKLTGNILSKRAKTCKEWEHIFKPVRNSKDCKVVIKGQEITEEHQRIMKENGITMQQVRYRVNTGWDIERAITQKVIRRSSKNKYYSDLPKDEAIRIVKRVRRLNATDFRDCPVAIPKVEKIAGMKVNE